MIDSVRAWLRKQPRARWFYPIWILLTAVVFLTAVMTGGSFLPGYTCLLVLILFALRSNSAVYAATMEKGGYMKKLVTLLVALITVAGCILPMDMLPIWNGEVPGHRNQYELMAENILEGRIYFDYGDEAGLLEMENPYDPDARDKAGVRYHWDHAFYNGRYYMYFGIVPVFLAFLPYRIITGAALTTFHATQLFTALTIAGVFVLFDLLTKRFFKRLPYCVYLALSVAFSVMSVWYATAEPALYCTAITAGLALEVWSLYFFIRAVYVEKKENKQIFLATVGALLGALVFGCRPTIALGNLLVIPMLINFVKQREFDGKLLGKLALAALPYALVAAGLMLYNYARFDDPFEFGQKYQLTVADQSQYSIALNANTILRIINDSLESFFSFGDIRSAFPYLHPSGVFFNFPILLLIAGVCKVSVLKNMHYAKVLPLIAGIVVTVLIITAMDILWTPYLLERYHMDIYFLLGIGCFMTVGFWFNICTAKQRRGLCAVLSMLAVLTVISACLLCIYRIGVYYPGKVKEIGQLLQLIA